MFISLTTPLAALCSIFRSRAVLELENLTLRHQIGVLQRSARKRPKLTSGDRLLWVCLSRLWRDWRSTLMCRENPAGGAPRIHGELLKLGIDIGESSVSIYMARGRNPPSQTWRTFLGNHLTQTGLDRFLHGSHHAFPRPLRVSGIGP
jgi:putative transposase